ncbi:hypothetical protein BGZ70_009298 [Mortierella alpina]|uniref:Uncharacterized protein n=1 Tax=Mortierella alpina TaxID=64518 RepID=A0A9P6M0I0_MORAP|nr:hypothetical protein BGZ70_009298 [Mortierella alpina]
MEPPLPQPPANETSQFYSSSSGPARVGSLLLQSVKVTVPTFSKDLDLGSIANPQRHSTLKQYLFASLLFKPLLALLLDCFSLAFLSSWVRNSVGKGNSSGLVVYALATTGSLAIVVYGGWRASQVLKKAHIQAIFVNREAYRWVCLRSKERFLFFERVGQGYGHMDALVFFTWFTLRDWMQHLLCDLPRLIINCTILGQVAYQQSLKNKGEAPTLTLPELSGITHAALAFNIMLQLCNLVQFLGALVVLGLVRMGKLISLRKDEHLHTYCQRNLNVRIVRFYKIAKAPGTTAPLRENNHLEQQMNQYRAEEEAMGLGPEGGIDLSLAALAWDTETQDDHVDYNHYAYRPRPISSHPPARAKQPSGREDGGERIEMTEKQPVSPSTTYQLPAFSGPAPVPGSFSYAQMQHLQLQRQKYGDNKELYETMVWTPASSSMESHGQGSQGAMQYTSPPPPPPAGSNWTSPNVGTPLPPVPRKDY